MSFSLGQWVAPRGSWPGQDRLVWFQIVVEAAGDHACMLEL